MVDNDRVPFPFQELNEEFKKLIASEKYKKGFEGVFLANEVQVQGQYQKAQFVLEKSLFHFDQAVELSEGDPKICVGRGFAHFGLGSLTNSLGDYKASEHHWRRAIEDFSKITRESPDYQETLSLRGTAHASLADLLVKLGQRKEAWEHCQKAITDLDVALDVDNITSYVGICIARGTTYIVLGMLEHNRNQNEAKGYYRKAIGDFKRALSKSSSIDAYTDLGSAYLQLGNLFISEGSPDKARQNFRLARRNLDDAVKLKPNKPEVYSNRALANIGLGEHELAIEDLKRVVELVPTNTRYRQELARELKLMRRFEEALDHYHIIFQLTPGREGLLNEILEIAEDEMFPEMVKQGYYFDAVKQIRLKNWYQSKDNILRNLPVRPAKDDFGRLLKHIIEKEYASHVTLADPGSKVQLKTYVHELAGFVEFVEGNVFGPAAEILVKVANSVVLGHLDAAMRKRSQIVVAALSEEKVNVDGGFADKLSEALKEEYGGAVEHLELNSLGAITLALTMVERMFTQISDNPDLAERIRNGEADPIVEFTKMMKQGETNRLAMSLKYGRGEFIRYKTEEIISNLLN
jgi:tetratricopeptide (TPR) repeat protein